LKLKFAFFSKTAFSDKGYLGVLKNNPGAILFLGDSAYLRSAVGDKIGLKIPVPQKKDGTQQTVRIFFFFAV
jgi:hypothetical protein